MINIEASGSDIVYWGRDSEKDVYKKIVKDFRPYFYVSDALGTFTSCFGEKLKKIFTRLPGDVPKRRLMYDRHFEADILYKIRFLVDKTDILEKEPIRVCHIDIETESGPDAKQKFPDVNNPQNKIVSVCCYDNFDSEFKMFALGDRCGFDLCEVEYFMDEAEMIKSFCKYIRKKDFDLFFGYNCENFDFPYIIRRMEKLKMDRTLLSRDNVQSYIDNYEHIHIWGRDLLDCFWAVKNLVSGERHSWKLGDVAQDELGYGKVKFDCELWELYRDDKKKFLEYNYNDVKLTVDLEKKYSMVDYFDEIRRITKTTWDNVMTTNIVNDCLSLQFCKGRYILPSIVRRKKEGYEGAHTEVYDSGVFRNVLVFDYRSLYPTIMMKYNISFETIAEGDEFRNDKVISVGNGTYFKKDKLGIVPEMLYFLFKKRMEYQRKMKECVYGSSEYIRYKTIQKAYKVLLNSRYGDYAFTGSRLYNLKCADAVTFVGRKIILKSVEVAEKLGLKILYCHTDSLLFISEKSFDMSKEELKILGERLSEEIELEVRKLLPKNDLLPDVTLDLEFEKICYSAFFNKNVKSRNAKLVMYDSGEFLSDYKLEITGFSSVRSDFPKILQDLLNDVFRMILNFKPEKEVLDVVLSFEKKFLSSSFDINDICIVTGINVDIPDDIVKGLSYHVKGAVNYNKYCSDGEIKVKKGDKVKVAYVKTNSRNIEVISFLDTFPEGLEVDYKKMWERYKNVFVDVFDCLGWHSLKTGSFSLGQFSGRKIVVSEQGKSDNRVGLFKFGGKR